MNIQEYNKDYLNSSCLQIKVLEKLIFEKLNLAFNEMREARDKIQSSQSSFDSLSNKPYIDKYSQKLRFVEDVYQVIRHTSKSF